MRYSAHTHLRKKSSSRSLSVSKIVFSVFYFFFVFSFAHAATLSLDPGSGNFGPGDMFVVTVRLDTKADECVNAATIELLYSPDLLKVTAVSKGESLMTLWADEPIIDAEHGKVSFSGGIPAGYCGRVQGDPGKTNILAKIAFGVQGGGKTSPMKITFGTSSKILLNDGFGTPAAIDFNNASFGRGDGTSGIKNEWLDIVHADNTPPDPFKVTIAHEANTLDGKYFIVFLAVDKQSGVHHYEVREDDPARLGFVRGKNTPAQFTVATSPYMLKDQELKSRVTVRAIDNAGNIQESILAPSGDVLTIPKSEKKKSLLPWTLGIFVILFAPSMLYFRRGKKLDPGEIHNTEIDDEKLL